MIKNIIYIHDQVYISGGAAKIAIQAAISLKEMGYRVIYFSALGPADEALKKSDVEIITIGGNHIGQTKKPTALINAIWNKNANRKLMSLLSRLNPEETVVHIHGWTKVLSASIFDACRKRGVRTLVTMHDYFTVCGNGGLYNYKTGSICKLKPLSAKCLLCNCDKKNYVNKIYRNIRQIITRRALMKCRPDVIYISNYSRRILEQYVDFSNKTYLVENHVDIFSEKKINAVENECFLFIGRISDEKGPDIFCEAISKTGSKGIVIGEGPMRVNLEKKYPNIVFTGWLSASEMDNYLLKARCLIITSKLHETMGLTVIEALGRGIPCIVSRKCAASEYIDDDKTGLVYNIEDIDDLINKINKIKNDDFTEMLMRNINKSFEPSRFGMERHIAELVKVYEK